MSRVSIDALLAQYREAPKGGIEKEAAVIEKKEDVYDDVEIEKMASLLSDAELAELMGEESFEEKIAQALILGETLSSIKKKK